MAVAQHGPRFRPLVTASGELPRFLRGSLSNGTLYLGIGSAANEDRIQMAR